MKLIKRFVSFINRDGSKENESKYFMVVLRWSYCLMVLYYLVHFVFFLYYKEYTAIQETLIWLAGSFAGLFLSYRLSNNRTFLIYTILILTWSIIFIFIYGWNVGVQHLMLPILIISFFSLTDTLLTKLLFLFIIISLRLYLFFFCFENEPMIPLEPTTSFALQIINTLFSFAGLAIVCLIFSNNIQRSEKKLFIYNQKLKELASTDPLTTLYNRRYMMDLMAEHIRKHPRDGFCVALGDIDFFKKINDTLGHNCGDYVLRELAALFKKTAKDRGCVCRWGGEEFFFFFPNINLDGAGLVINELNIEISKHQMQYEDHSFRVTMTFGLEEYDYHSDLNELIRKADEKLYYGKEHGRNRVIC